MNYETFPFGKYKGTSLAELPTNYICHAIENFDLPEELSFDLKFILALRLNLTSDQFNRQKVKSIYKELSKKYHPDMGGTNEAFNAIKDFAERLDG